MSYLAIEEHGMIGDMHTMALVGTDGTIDWFCFPHFDSPSVFASILDHEKGGYFSVAPIHSSNVKQVYWPDTNVLVTKFLSAEGVCELVDYMPVSNGKADHKSQIVRTVRGVRGGMKLRMVCAPAMGYAQLEHRLEIKEQQACFYSPSLNLHLASTLDLAAEGSAAVAEFQVKAGESVAFVLSEWEERVEQTTIGSVEEANQGFNDTIKYWRKWLSKSTYKGRWRETVFRSALTLKLLTFEPTGAIVAAPTCSLPEGIGGERNWDYRYTWIRDAAFTIYALIRIGFTEEAAHFMKWVEARCEELNPDGSMQIMYGIDGRHMLTEITLDHLEGYKKSVPVRIGNGAYDQLQLDIYGELLDSVYLFNKYGSPISYHFWTSLRRLVDWVCENWHRTDEGIWEVRGGQQHFVYSKLMCWVAIDRGLRIAEKRSFPADRVRWYQTRDAIYEEIMSQGWNPKKEAFVQHYGSDALDASNLMMSLVLFLAPDDPQMLKTLYATMESPANGGLLANGLVYRYNVHETDDGLKGEEGTFNICTFWLVEALTRAGKVEKHCLEEARLIFEHMLSYANHLGLYAEETGPCGEGLGNFPQAFTHLALISAAVNLDRALDRR